MSGVDEGLKGPIFKRKLQPSTFTPLHPLTSTVSSCVPVLYRRLVAAVTYVATSPLLPAAVDIGMRKKRGVRGVHAVSIFACLLQGVLWWQWIFLFLREVSSLNSCEHPFYHTAFVSDTRPTQLAPVKHTISSSYSWKNKALVNSMAAPMKCYSPMVPSPAT